MTRTDIRISDEKTERMERDFYIDKNNSRHGACSAGEDINDNEQRNNVIRKIKVKMMRYV